MVSAEEIKAISFEAIENKVLCDPSCMYDDLIESIKNIAKLGKLELTYIIPSKAKDTDLPDRLTKKLVGAGFVARRYESCIYIEW